MSNLAEFYKNRLPALRKAELKLRSLLAKTISLIDDKTLVRAQLNEIRIKELKSVERKAKKENWKSEEALDNCGDLIGARIVCNNSEDVYRFFELLKENFPGHIRNIEKQDWILQPKGGYRALHINFYLDISDHIAPDFVPCEVQIRTLLQDAWAKLTHSDIYKQSDLPEDLKARAVNLAAMLALADEIATNIRTQVAEKTTAPDKQPNLNKVTADGIAFAFRQVFGRSPPDYVVRQVINTCEELEISSLEKFQKNLTRNDLREQLDKTYQAVMRVPLSQEEIAIAVLYASSQNDKAALTYIERRALLDYEEIDGIYKREVLGCLPQSIDKLLKEIEDGDANLSDLASVFETTSNCRVCGTTIIDNEALAEALIEHYDLTDADDIRSEIESAIYQSGAECGGFDDNSLCSYHYNQEEKD